MFRNTCCNCCASPSARARFSSNSSEHFHAVARKIVAAQLDRLPQHRVDVHRFALHRPLPRKTQQILHDLLRALRLLQNNLQILARIVGNRRIFQQQIRESQNRRQRIVHLVRHAGNQPPDRRHLLRVRQFRLQQHRIRDVGHHHHHAVHRALLVAHRAQADRKMPHRSIAAPHPQLQVLHLLPVRRRLQRRLKILAMSCFHPIHQPMPDQFVFAIARLKARRFA